ncbi:hypothetical protein CEXT_543061 [Caerostris extrusa]|uniref:Uncharacterized protein n=1 Tax=Caerostris extrusa TaxID=172846 RepID=A0AAV4PYX7_CAEEX|nr:hypothetical protein CEXT_543061 [Caerostris extrusa]
MANNSLHLQAKSSKFFQYNISLLEFPLQLSLNRSSSFIHNESKDLSHSEFFFWKHFRQHKGFNASTMDEQRNDGVMKMYHLLKRWWLFHELTQPDSRMPWVVCINDCHCFFWHIGSIYHDTKHDIVLFLIPCLLGEQSKKGEVSFGTPFLVFLFLLDAGVGQGRGGNNVELPSG